jgi:hypothetical protein
MHCSTPAPTAFTRRGRRPNRRPSQQPDILPSVSETGDAADGIVWPDDEWDSIALNYTSGTTQRSRGRASGRSYRASRQVQRHHHLRRRKHLVDRDRGCAVFAPGGVLRGGNCHRAPALGRGALYDGRSAINALQEMQMRGLEGRVALVTKAPPRAGPQARSAKARRWFRQKYSGVRSALRVPRTYDTAPYCTRL